MDAQRKVPMLVAAIIAVVGQTVILFNDFGPGNDSQGRGNARMITATAVSRAGAIEIPSDSPRRSVDILDAGKAWGRRHHPLVAGK
jgi:hypothetical protein